MGLHFLLRFLLHCSASQVKSNSAPVLGHILWNEIATTTSVLLPQPVAPSTSSCCLVQAVSAAKARGRSPPMAFCCGSCRLRCHGIAPHSCPDSLGHRSASQ